MYLFQNGIKYIKYSFITVFGIVHRGSSHVQLIEVLLASSIHNIVKKCEFIKSRVHIFEWSVYYYQDDLLL